MSTYNPFAKYGRRSIDNIPTGSGKDEELTRRAEDDRFRRHLALNAHTFPTLTPKEN